MNPSLLNSYMIFMKYENGKVFLGKQWAGAVRYDDFYHPSAEKYW